MSSTSGKDACHRAQVGHFDYLMCLDISVAGGTPGSGTVTSMGTGTGLTGGPITSTGTISLANTAVTPGSYTLMSATVDQQGRLTAAASGTAVTSVGTGTGLTGGPITSTGTVSLANTAVTPGSYTYTSLTVDQQGRLTAAASGAAPSSGTVTSVGTGTGLTGGPITTTGTVVLADTAVTPGSYTNASLTVDQQGRLTAASSSTVAPLLPAMYQTSSDSSNVGGDVVTVLNYATAVVADANYTVAASGITVAAAGVYEVGAGVMVRLENDGGSGDVLILTLKLNGAAVAVSSRRLGTDDTAAESNISMPGVMVTCVPSDEISMEVSSDSGNPVFQYTVRSTTKNWISLKLVA